LVVNRFWIAMAAFAALALLAWTTLADEKLRVVTLAVLAMFAVKTLLFRKRMKLGLEPKRLEDDPRGPAAVDVMLRTLRAARRQHADRRSDFKPM
jgi:hypothetical protein